MNTFFIRFSCIHYTCEKMMSNAIFSAVYTKKSERENERKSREGKYKFRE